MQIEHQGTVCTDQKSKAHLFFQFYTDLIGQTSTQVPKIHWDNLYPSKDNARELQVLQEDITLRGSQDNHQTMAKEQKPRPGWLLRRILQSFHRHPSTRLMQGLSTSNATRHLSSATKHIVHSTASKERITGNSTRLQTDQFTSRNPKKIFENFGK